MSFSPIKGSKVKLDSVLLQVPLLSVQLSCRLWVLLWTLLSVELLWVD